MAPSKIILLACGSFNPPTNMHLRMFELARDNLNRLGQYIVIGGIVSPVHEGYGKKELIPGTFRCQMLKLALKSSDWIQISDWECSQETWSKTRRVLQYHQNLINSVLNNEKDCPNNNQRNDLENGNDYSSWITNDIRNTEGPVQIKLLCGADLLESFATPGLWADEDIETIIGQHGIVVITREGTDPRRFIYESDVLTKYQNNIIIVTEWITNDVSSTKVRRALRRQESVKYLIEDSVIEFIKKHGLYGTTKNDAKYCSNPNQNVVIPIYPYILTPSPSDLNIVSACSFKNDINISLQPIPKEGITSSGKQNLNTKIFQSSMEIKISGNNEKMERNQFEAHKNLEPIVLDSCTELKKTLLDVELEEKVGFVESQRVKEICNNNILEGNHNRSTNELKEISEPQRKPSKKHIKGCQHKKIIKADSEKNNIHETEKNILLRRSKSDAIMSKKTQNKDTASVKIRLTKDGIKVISDKESIV